MPNFTVTPATDAPAITRDDLTEGGRPYPARLRENMKSWMGEGNKRRLVWFQRFERLDQVWPDGNPVERYNQPVLQWPNGEFARKGGEVDVIADAFEQCIGVDMLPDNTDSAGFIGHVFMLRDQKVPNTEKIYLRIPTEYVGDTTYTYTGTVRTLEGKGGGASVETVSDPAADLAAAQKVAEIINGMTEEAIRNGQAFNLVTTNPQLAQVQSVYGVSLRGGLVKPKARLLDTLIEQGIVSIQNGKVTN